MPQPITIVLVDEHTMVREAIGFQINAEPDMLIVGEAGDANNAIDVILRNKPNVVLFDIELPGMNCFAAVRTIASREPGVRVIFLSAFHHDRYVEKALNVRARGYVTKGESFAVVRDAIHTVAAGKVYFADPIKSRIVVHNSGFQITNGIKSRSWTLTPREREVLGYLAHGMAVKEVARIMHLSPKTVDNHKSNLMAKLDIHDRVELARFAIREGLASV